MTLSYRTLEEFAAFKGRLAAALTDAADVFTLLNDRRRADALAITKSGLMIDQFRVLVLGEMKRGKSTLINALLGERVLPQREGIACTAVPIVLRFGERRRAVCYRRPPEGPDEFDLVRERETFEAAVTIPEDGLDPGSDDTAAAIGAHPYVRAEVYAPVEFCRLGVELQDCAGLNESAARADATWRQAAESDAVIIVFSCGAMGTDTEKQLLRRVLESGRDPR